jgi:hypothetical protein
LRYPDCHHQSHPLFLFQSQSIFALDLLITAVAVLDPEVLTLPASSFYLSWTFAKIFLPTYLKFK